MKRRRALSPVVAVTLTVAAAMASCAKDAGTSSTSATADASAPAADPVAARLAELRDRFHAVIPSGVGARFEPLPSGRVAAVVPAAPKRRVLRSASVELPSTASGETRVTDDTTHVSVSFAMTGASAQRIATTGEGIALYAGAGPGGSDIVHRLHAEGTEDYVVFEAKPEREVLRYDVDVSRVAGLRLVSNVLELLDEGGAPRLRVASPYVVNASGKKIDATIAVDGCAYDVNPSGPWGRAVTRPGAERCAVTVAWAGAVYPAMVDPSWTATGSMTTTRWDHTATLLPSGTVLVAGGQDNDGNYLSSAELFDGTSSFAATGSMTTARYYHTATLLPSGKVLVAGGDAGSGSLPSAELFDGTSSFAATGSMTTARDSHTATLLPSGKVLVAGGEGGASSSAELFDGTSSFTATGSMTTARSFHTATLLPSGRVLLTGGDHGGNPQSSAEALRRDEQLRGDRLDDGAALLSHGDAPPLGQGARRRARL